MNSTIRVSDWLAVVRRERPLVHNITNVVVTNVVANALLSIGASPVMAYAHEEVADMAGISAALALNMGTLDASVVEAMFIAGRAANHAGVPIVFDPVGVGATPYRNQTAEGIIEALHLAVLRGNAGEIGFLLGAGGEVKGVDSIGSGEQLPDAMRKFAREHSNVIVATGPVDYVTDGDRIFALSNGHPLMATITGSGCQATGLLGAFTGVVKTMAQETGRLTASDLQHLYAEACVAALTCANVAGEIAAAHAEGPGTFQSAWFDALYKLDDTTVDKMAKIQLLEV